jgi:hypothetical protein
MGADPRTRVALNHTRIWLSLEEVNAELAAGGFRVQCQELRPQNEPSGAGALIVTVAES